MFPRRSWWYRAYRWLFNRWIFARHPQKAFYEAIKQILGVAPTDLSLYETALVHRSAAYVNEFGRTVNNERLEYLGDALLSAIIAEYLFYKFPDQPEGFLTQTRSKMVNRVMLGELAVSTGLHNLIKRNIYNERNNKNVYGDAFEAFIGALYLDKGYEPTRKFIVHLIRNYINIKQLAATDTNYKSKLIEWAQKNKVEMTFATEQDAENARIFTARVMIRERSYGEGIGTSKKEAEQRAAQAALERIEKGDDIETETNTTDTE